MIDYWKKDLTFHVFDHPIENPNLTCYTIKSLKINHSERSITIKFLKEDAILAIGIFIVKIQQISIINTFDLSFFMCEGDSCVEVSPNSEELKDAVQNSKSNEFTLLIISDCHNLLLEKNIIVYFNVNDEYEDSSLNNILDQINSPSA